MAYHPFRRSEALLDRSREGLLLLPGPVRSRIGHASSWGSGLCRCRWPASAGLLGVPARSARWAARVGGVLFAAYASPVITLTQGAREILQDHCLVNRPFAREQVD